MQEIDDVVAHAGTVALVDSAGQVIGKVRSKRVYRAAAVVATRSTRAKVLSRSQVGKARTKDGGPSSRIEPAPLRPVTPRPACPGIGVSAEGRSGWLNRATRLRLARIPR